MMSFMSLMADYVRLHLIVTSVTERKQALGMYYYAHATVHGRKTGVTMAKVSSQQQKLERLVARGQGFTCLRFSSQLSGWSIIVHYQSSRVYRKRERVWLRGTVVGCQ